MTAHEWDVTDQPILLIGPMQDMPQAPPGQFFGRPSDRKLSLFAAAYWRWYVREKPAYGYLSAKIRALETWAETGEQPLELVPENLGIPEPTWGIAEGPLMMGLAGESEIRSQARKVCLIRCIFCNPFRPVTLAPSWLTPDVVSLARAAYDERHFPSGELDPERMTILADALEDEGAPDGLLDHLRSPGPHVRGCHVIDLCLLCK